MKKSVLKNFAKFVEKPLCRSLFFNKAAGVRPSTLFKTKLQHSFFPETFAKFLGTLFTKHLRMTPYVFQVHIWKDKLALQYDDNEDDDDDDESL